MCYFLNTIAQNIQQINGPFTLKEEAVIKFLETELTALQTKEGLEGPYGETVEAGRAEVLRQQLKMAESFLPREENLVIFLKGELDRALQKPVLSHANQAFPITERIQTVGQLQKTVREAFAAKDKKLIAFLEGKLNWLLQKAILCGEYYQEAALDKMKEIKQLIDSIGQSFSAKLESPDTASRRAPLMEALYKSIRTADEQYLEPTRELIEFVAKNLEKFDTGSNASVADISKFKNYMLKRQLAEILKQDFEDEDHSLFQINMLLVYMDEGLECNQETLSVLESIRVLKKYKKNQHNEDILSILIDKAAFLEYKIKYRQRLFYYKNTDDEINIRPVPFPELGDDNHFHHFRKKISHHYGNDLLVAELKSQVKSFGGLPVGDWQIEPFHHLNRYYRKSRGRSEDRKAGIEELLDIVYKRWEAPGVSLYNKVSFKSLYNLLFNSSLSIDFKTQEERKFPDVVAVLKQYLKDSGDKIESGFLTERFQAIRKFSSQEGVPDFYCFIHYARFLNALIDFLIRNPGIILDAEITSRDAAVVQAKIAGIMDHIRGVYKRNLASLNDSLGIMITHEVKPVNMTSNECFTPYKKKQGGEDDPDSGEGIEALFLRSSYVLPNDFERIKEDIKSWSSFLGPQLNQLKDSFEIELGKCTIQNNIASFEKRAKENEFKVVQIVALFVTIASFVLGSVKIFEGKTSLESFGIILGLAACFFLFNLFFYFIVFLQHNKLTNKQIAAKIATLAILPVVLTISSFLILEAEKDKGADREMIKLFEQRIDSLTKQLMRMDSLDNRLRKYEEAIFINKSVKAPDSLHRSQ